MAKASQLTLDAQPPVVSTSDGTTTVTIATVTAFAATNGGQEITFDVLGYDFDNSEVASAKISVKLKNIAGTVSMVGTPVHLVPIAAGSSSGLATASVNVVIAGSNLKVNVIGVAGRTIYWTCTRWPSVQVLDGYTTASPYDVTGTIVGGDLTGTLPNPTIAKLQGRTFTDAGGTLADESIIQWQSSGNRWLAGVPIGTAVSNLAFSGDLSGTFGGAGAIVDGLQGKSLDSALTTIGAAQDGYVLTWDNGDSRWEAKILGGTNPTDGYVLTWVSGSNAWLPRPTGILVPMGGDVTGTLDANTVVTLTGSSNIVTLGVVGSAFTLQKPSRVSDAATSALNIVGQAAYSSAATNYNGGHIQITGGAGANTGVPNAGGYVYIDGGARAGTTPGSVDGYIYIGSGTTGFVQIKAGSDSVAAAVNCYKNRIDIVGLQAQDPVLYSSALNPASIEWSGAAGAGIELKVGSGNHLMLSDINTSTSVGAAGGGSALPATPVGYIVVAIGAGGTSYKIPYYNT